MLHGERRPIGDELEQALLPRGELPPLPCGDADDSGHPPLDEHRDSERRHRPCFPHGRFKRPLRELLDRGGFRIAGDAAQETCADALVNVVDDGVQAGRGANPQAVLAGIDEEDGRVVRAHDVAHVRDELGKDVLELQVGQRGVAHALDLLNRLRDGLGLRASGLFT